MRVGGIWNNRDLLGNLLVLSCAVLTTNGRFQQPWPAQAHSDQGLIPTGMKILVISLGKSPRPGEVLVENAANLKWMVEEKDNNISYSLKAIYTNRDKKDYSSSL